MMWLVELYNSKADLLNRKDVHSVVITGAKSKALKYAEEMSLISGVIATVCKTDEYENRWGYGEIVDRMGLLNDSPRRAKKVVGYEKGILPILWRTDRKRL